MYSLTATIYIYIYTWHEMSSLIWYIITESRNDMMRTSYLCNHVIHTMMFSHIYLLLKLLPMIGRWKYSIWIWIQCNSNLFWFDRVDHLQIDRIMYTQRFVFNTQIHKLQFYSSIHYGHSFNWSINQSKSSDIDVFFELMRKLLLGNFQNFWFCNDKSSVSTFVASCIDLRQYVSQPLWAPWKSSLFAK